MLIESKSFVADPNVCGKWRDSQCWWWLMNDSKQIEHKRKKVGAFTYQFRGDTKFEREIQNKYPATKPFRHDFQADLPAGDYVLGVGPASSPHHIREELSIPFNPRNTWEVRAAAELYFRVSVDDPNRLYFQNRARDGGELLGRTLLALFKNAQPFPESRAEIIAAYCDEYDQIRLHKFMEMRSLAYIEMEEVTVGTANGGFSSVHFDDINAVFVHAEKQASSTIFTV